MRRWMHGVNEQDLFDALLSQNTVVDESLLNEADRELAGCILSGNLKALKELQMGRIVSWFRQVADVEHDPHVQCYRSMAALLRGPDWDEDMIVWTAQRCLQENVNFLALEQSVLRLTRSLTQVHVDEQASHVESIHATMLRLWNLLGPPMIVSLFEDICEWCSCADCPDSKRALTRLWNATKNQWIEISQQERQEHHDDDDAMLMLSLQRLRRCAARSFGTTLSELLHECACMSWDQLPSLISLHTIRSAQLCRRYVNALKPTTKPTSKPTSQSSSLLHSILNEHVQGKSPLACDAEWVYGGPISQVLLEEGADPSSITRAERVCPRVLHCVLQCEPRLAHTLLQSPMLERVVQSASSCTSHSREALLMARTLKKNNAQVPSELVQSMLKSPEKSTLQILCALFSYQVVHMRQYPELKSVMQQVDETDKELFFMWRPHTHVFCSKQVQDSVILCMMSLKSLCPIMPRDIRNMIAVHVTAKNWFEHDE